MRSPDLREGYAWLSLGAAAGMVLTGCKGTEERAPSGEQAAELFQKKQASHLDDVPDAGDRAFIVRAAIALLGRPPIDADEMASYLNTVKRLGAGRGAVLDAMMVHPDYVERWSNFLLDKLRVARRGDRTNTGCFNESPWWDAIQAEMTDPAFNDPEEKEAALRTLGTHLAVEDIKAQFSPFKTKVPTMRDAIRSSVLVDDLRGPYRANLFAQMVTPLGGNETSQANIREDFFERFEDSYINRQHLCLGCHNTVFSVSGPSYDFDRHFPTPYKVEEPTFGSADAVAAQPPDLHADFRTLGVTPGSLRPWGLAAACGTFNPAPAIETCNQPFESLTDTCYEPTDDPTRRAPKAKFAAEGTVSASVLRLNELLASGIFSYAMSFPQIPSKPLVDVEDVTLPGGEKVLKGARAFALMVASNIVDRVWEEVHGTRLTIANHFPRSEAQRDLLHELSHGFMRTPIGAQWSLKYLLRQILLHNHFNARLRTNDEFTLDVLYDPWVIQDPRPNPDFRPITERCDATSPTYTGCVKGLLLTNGCVNCHENPASGAADIWDHHTLSTILSKQFATFEECDTLVKSAECKVPMEKAIDCQALVGKPAGRFVARLSCAADAEKHMPQGQGFIPEPDRQSILRWVMGNGQPGTAPPPTPDPAPEQEHNGVGDMVHWKSAYQLTNTFGKAVGLDPWRNTVPGVSGYPKEAAAEAAGHYMDSTRPGGRGVSYLSFLQWERENSQGGPCKVGSGDDRIKDLVAKFAAKPAAEQMSIDFVIKQLKLSFMGEDHLTPAELPVLELAAGLHMHTRVSADTAAAVEVALRKVCDVFSKSPLFMLSYVEPVLSEKPIDLGWPSGLGPDLLNPDRWNRRWLRTFLKAPAGCTPPSWITKPIDEWENALPDIPNGNCPTTGWVLPALCRNRPDCRPPSVKLERKLIDCLAAGHGCQGTDGPKVHTLVKEMLGDLRLPVPPPPSSGEESFEPAEDASPFDQRFRNNLIVLPFAGGTITSLSGGQLKAYRSGTWKWMAQGETIAHGQTLFIPAGLKLKVTVGGVVYETGPNGMEKPLDIPGPSKSTLRSHYGWDTAWVVVANGPEAQTQPPATRDSSIAMGTLHGPQLPQPMRGRRPAWSAFGAAGGWYKMPFPLPSEPKPAWQPGKFYAVGAQVTHAGLDYRCYQAHTTQVGWEPPKVYNLWERINAGSVWTLQVIYEVGDVVSHNGKAFRAIQINQAQVGWEPPRVPALRQPL